MGPFPSWSELVDGIVGAPFPASMKGYSPETLMRAAQDRNGLDDDGFRAMLGRALYKRLQGDAASDWPLIKRGLSSMPNDLKVTEWQTYLSWFARYPDFSGAALAKAIDRARAAGVGPRAVLSFNAEPLLLSLLNGAGVVRSGGADVSVHYECRHPLHFEQDAESNALLFLPRIVASARRGTRGVEIRGPRQLGLLRVGIVTSGVTGAQFHRDHR